MPNYIKKPIVIEAIRYIGSNGNEITKFSNGTVTFEYTTTQMYPEGVVCSLEGNHSFTTGDYIIKGFRGEFYACRGDIFEETYDEVF